MPPSTKSVMVIGDGYVAKNTLSSLVGRHGNTVEVVAGVPDPSAFVPMTGVRATKADLWDKEALTNTLKGGKFCRIFLVLPGHADRVQMGWNGLEAAREAGILQVVLVSVLTAESFSANSEGLFKPLRDNVQQLGRIEVPVGSPLSSPNPTMVPEDPSTCVRIQRRNVLNGWYPMKVKLLQISLPSLDPASRCGKSSPMMIKMQQDNGIAELQRAFQGPYEQKSAAPLAPAAAYITDMQRELFARKEQLLESSRSTAALSNLSSAAASLGPIVPSTTPTNLLYSDVLEVLRKQRQALQQQPQWL